MNDQDNDFILFMSLEGKESYTEVNMFEGFVACLNSYYKLNNIVMPSSIDGDIKNKQDFINEFEGKIKWLVENKTNIKFDPTYKLTIVCIWDSTNKKNNIIKNYQLLKDNLKDWFFEKIIFSEGIEMGFINLFLKKPCKNIEQLVDVFGYKQKTTFKKRDNKKIFFRSMEIANIEINNYFLQNLNKRFKENNSNHIQKIKDICSI